MVYLVYKISRELCFWNSCCEKSYIFMDLYLYGINVYYPSANAIEIEYNQTY